MLINCEFEVNTVYIDSTGINVGDANLKLWKPKGKQEQPQKTAENASMIDEDIPGPTVEASTETSGVSDVPETYKEHYPLLASHFLTQQLLKTKKTM